MPLLKTRHLTATINRSSVNEEARTVEIAVSSETPVDRWGALEVLDHSPGAVDLSRFRDGAAFLLDHDPTKQIGVIESPQLGADRVLRATVRLGRSTQAQEALQDIVDGIKSKISVGYSYDWAEVDSTRTPEGVQLYTIKKWQPMEASLVAIPADATVGVGRSKAKAEDPDGPLDPDGELDPEDPENPDAGDEPDDGEDPERKGRSATHNLAHRAANPKEPIMGAENINGGQSAAHVEELKTASTAATSRATEILDLCQTFGLSERAKDLIASGRDTNEIKAEILAEAQKRLKPVGVGVDLNPKERQRYSYARAISMAADQAEGKRTSGFESEISDELDKQMPATHKRRGGLFIPTSLRASKLQETMGASGPTLTESQRLAVMNFLTRAGGSGSIDSQTANYIKEVVFTQYGGELIEVLRNAALVVKMGARVLPGLSSPIAFPRQTADMAASWVAENSGSDVTGSQVATDLVTLTPKSLQGTTAYSRQLLVQSSVDVEAMVIESLAYSHSLAWDLAAIHGDGTGNSPKGIYGISGVGSHPFSGNPTYADLLAMESLVADANAILGALGWLTRPSAASKMKGTLEFAVNGSKKLWEGTILEGEVDGYIARASNQVKKTLGAGTNETGIIFGNWNDLLIGQFGGAMETIVDPYSKKKQGLIEVTSFQMCDVQVRHPASFAVGTAMVIS